MKSKILAGDPAERGRHGPDGTRGDRGVPGQRLGWEFLFSFESFLDAFGILLNDFILIL